jgi:hypothetical protein
MKDLRKDLWQHTNLRQALGYKLRKHELRLTDSSHFSQRRAPTGSPLDWPPPGQPSLRKAINTTALKGWFHSIVCQTCELDGCSNGNSTNRHYAPTGDRASAKYLYTGKKSAGSWQRRARGA